METSYVIYWPEALVVPGLYLAACLAASIHASRKRGWQHLPILPLVFATTHLSWGSGFLTGIVRFGLPHFTPRSLIGAFRSP